MSGHATHALRLQSLAAFCPLGFESPASFLRTKKAPNGTLLQIHTGGELGIRTPDALLGHTRLAGEHLRPLGQLSVTAVL